MYEASARRVVATPIPISNFSALRFPVTTNSAPAPATIRNHGEIDTPTATPPAIARNTNPDDTAKRSNTGSCLSQRLYAVVSAR